MKFLIFVFSLNILYYVNCGDFGNLRRLEKHTVQLKDSLIRMLSEQETNNTTSTKQRKKTTLTPYIEDPEAQSFVLKLKQDIKSNQLQIKKTIFNNKKRVLFVAGLEGSGHHALHSMFSVCFAEGMCVAEQDISHDVMWYDPVAKIIHGLFSADDGDQVRVCAFCLLVEL
jgi:hypothetical protein